MAVYRVYVEKKPAFAVEAQGVYADLCTALQPEGLTGVRMFNRYDIEGIDESVLAAVKPTILSEPQVDTLTDELPAFGPTDRVFAVEYLPGQFDQRADSCAQCIQIITQKERPLVRTAKVYVLCGAVSEADCQRAAAYLINPVDSRLASLEKPESLAANYQIPETVETLAGFIGLAEDALAGLIGQYGLAMDADDLRFCQRYFQEEGRDPTITELRMIDTYWSDHCRHTTFLTQIDGVEIGCDYIKEAYERYLSLRATLYPGRERPVTLMDMATIGAKALAREGYLDALDRSEEINACSVKIQVEVAGEKQDWLLMFKNETHNHPTEIEPFGGAATCLGGAIRDPLSGRSYVYQAMRVTGAGDPLLPVEKTLPGKLPQSKLVTTAAAGYSSYGNQIGLATGQVSELYHPGYVAKRLEIGAVVGAAPAENVVRKTPEPGDVVVLLGGKTGRDGCGGATGSSKSHTLQSLESCGAEVQKGNAPEERKLQRLFRDPAVTRLIKRCNDFGAGGVSVAIGELADGLSIDLNKVPRKYDGLDGTELAISESQERMAVVVAPSDLPAFIEHAARENLDATPVAEVTAKPRLTMRWNGRVIVDLSREFLNSNGAPKHTTVSVPAPALAPVGPKAAGSTLQERFGSVLADLNICSQKGLVERFDSTIGAGSVLMPFGGVYQLTPAQAMAAKLPVLGGETTTCSLMAFGFNPYLGQQSPYHAALLAVVESVAKLIAAGGSTRQCWLTFQEYFERTKGDPARWGKPFAALLGALTAQMELKIGSIGGKDSMSGSFEQIDVPPTLVSFAVGVADARRVCSAEFKAPGHKVWLLLPRYGADGLPDFASLRATFDEMERLLATGRVTAAWTLGHGGLCEAVCKMAFGNRLGFAFAHTPDEALLYHPIYGGFVFEAEAELETTATLLGETIPAYEIRLAGERLDLEALQHAWEQTLAPVFPYRLPTPKLTVPTYTFATRNAHRPAGKAAKPRVLIPVFPGTNCEYDTARAFALCGGESEIFVIRNRSGRDIEESVAAFADAIGRSQIIAIPGGFSGGDEPDGSGKFITAFFRNPRVRDAVHTLLQQRDGLMLGICNGFQALIKLGLVPYGEIREMDENCPTLTYNKIGRHQSMLVRTRVASVKSPWLMHCQPGDIHTIAISHGEGRFVCSDELLHTLAQNGQIATQYVDLSGAPTLDIRYNPNASYDAVEGITSPDGRVLGKMGHTERFGDELYRNVPGNKRQPLFLGAIDYYK